MISAARSGGPNILAARHQNMADVQISSTFTENGREWVQLNDVRPRQRRTSRG